MYYKHTLLFSWKLLYNTLIDERSEATKCAVRMFIYIYIFVVQVRTDLAVKKDLCTTSKSKMSYQVKLSETSSYRRHCRSQRI